MIKKGIVLCGGTGSRLYPVTKSINKHLIPVYNKPMFFYSVSVLMLSDIRDILIVTGQNQKKYFQKILGKYKDLGVNFTFVEQNSADGIPNALLHAKEFVGEDKFALILGDNFFYGSNLTSIFKNILKKKTNGATIFLYPSKHPSNFGVVELNKKGQIYKILEKPLKTKSDLVITGLYLFDNKVFNIAEKLKKSKRNETEIVDIINFYKNKKKLKLIKLPRGSAWLDMGTFNDLIESSIFVQNIEKRQNYQIGCLEEIALRKKWIKNKNILNRIKEFKHSSYSNYLKDLIK